MLVDFLKTKRMQLLNYMITTGDDLIIKNPELIADYAEIIYESVNFRWTQILENNSSPRIAKGEGFRFCQD
jgi:hypothetical protein